MSLGALLAYMMLWHCHSLGFDNNEEAAYLSAFPDLVAASYSAPRPAALTTTCVNQGAVASFNTKTLTGTAFTATQLQTQCTKTDVCVIPVGGVLTMNGNLDVGALIIKGSLIWSDSTQPSTEQFLCAGYIAVDGGGFNLSVTTKKAYIYIKDNSAFDPILTKRGLGGYHGAVIDIKGKTLARTWSLLALPAKNQTSQLTLIHDATAMGWSIGDRIVIAPTTHGSSGTAESYFISNISGVNISLSALTGGVGVLGQDFDSEADWIEPAWTAQRQAEVIMMTRNVIITGDDFVQEPCQQGAPLTSANITCVCDTMRTQCTRGLHTAMVGNGTYRLQYARVEKCGQRGMLGKYCVHLHVLRRCPNCLIQGNSVEFSHQRGIVIHATSLATVDHNVMNNVRGANIYIEDGDEMYNRVRYNVLICPWAQSTVAGQPERYGCSIPGTDNGQADTSLNQAAIWGLSFSNYVIGNRGANSFNGMLYQGQGFENGRQTSQDHFCANTQMIGRLEGNTFHGHGRFGTYLLVSIFPKKTDRTLDSNGLIVDQNTCAAFDAQGEDRGLPQVVTYNVDYENVFVGQYGLGDIQYRYHTSIFNNELIYWKETKNFANGCSSHVRDSWWQGRDGQGIAMPGGHGTVILERVVFTGEINFESSHHCNIGTTGILCMPTYLFVQPTWKDVTSSLYIRWGENNGAMYVLGPDDCANPNGVMFPAGYCSIANPFWTFLTALDNGQTCQNASTVASLLNQSAAFVTRWASGILCKTALRRLEIYTQGQKLATAPNVKLQLWQNNVMISSVVVPYFQIADDNTNTGKQGYSMTIAPGLDKEYRLSLENGGPIPADWAIEFSDLVFGNRWTRDQIKLTVQGRTCPAIVHSHHDRRFIWGDSNDFNGTHNWMQRLGRGACTSYPDMPVIPCSTTPDISVAEQCPGKCAQACGINQYCDCGTGTCMCESGYEGPNCQASPCVAANCDKVNGRCSARFLGGTLPVALGQCVCKPGTYGPRCRSDPCSCTTCGAHGTCMKTSATTYYCQCDAGYQGPTCNTTCTDCAPPCIGGCQYYNNTDLSGPNTGALYTGTSFTGAVGCCAACQANPSCVAFVSPDYCYMKSNQSAPLSPRAGSTSGVLCQNLPPVTCPELPASSDYVISSAYGSASNFVWVFAVAFGVVSNFIAQN